MNHIFFIITITITNEIVNISKLLILQNNKQETVFIKKIILIFKNLETFNIINKNNLENIINYLKVLIKQI